MFRDEFFRGSAAAHGGEARPHRRAHSKSLSVEAQPRRRKQEKADPVSQRLTAVCGGKAATPEGNKHRKLTTCATSLLPLFLSAVFLATMPSLTLGLLTRAQNETPSPQAQPSP